jgi:hypothetical protein
VLNVPTKQSNDMVALFHFKRTMTNKIQNIQTFSFVYHAIPWCHVTYAEIHCDSAHDTHRHRPERWIVVQHLPIQMNANVGLQIFRALFQYLK